MCWVLLPVFISIGCLFFIGSNRLIFRDFLCHLFVGHLIHFLIAIISTVIRGAPCLYNRRLRSFGKGIKRYHIWNLTQWALSIFTNVLWSLRTISTWCLSWMIFRFSTILFCKRWCSRIFLINFVDFTTISTWTDRVLFVFQFDRVGDISGTLARLSSLAFITFVRGITILVVKSTFFVRWSDNEGWALHSILVVEGRLDHVVGRRGQTGPILTNHWLTNIWFGLL